MKFFATLLFALVAVHATTQSPLEGTSVAKTIAGIVGKVLAQNKIILEKANTFAEGLDANKDKYEKDFVDALSKVAVKVNGVVAALIAKLEVDTSADAKAIIECIAAEQTEVNTLVGKLLQQVADCQFATYGDYSTLVKNVLEQVNQLQANLEILTSNLNECDGDDSLCIGLFAGGIVEQVDDFLPSIKSLAAEAKTYLVGLVKSLKGCQIKETVHKDIVQVINEAAVCIKQ